MDIDLSTDAPPSPERTLQLAETLAGIVRVLNHQTRHPEALEYPSEADRLVREIASAAARLPQLLSQAGAWLERERVAGGIRVAGGVFAGNPDLAVVTARLRLDEARAHLAEAERSLSAAAQVTSALAAAQAGDGDD